MMHFEPDSIQHASDQAPFCAAQRKLRLDAAVLNGTGGAADDKKQEKAHMSTILTQILQGEKPF